MACVASPVIVRTCCLAVGLSVPPAWTQATTNKITNTSDGTLAAVVALGTLTPARSSAVQTGQVTFRLRSKTPSGNGGYRLDAIATFVATPTAPSPGGSSIQASDIGTGITSITYQAGVDQPRVDTIAAGFNYDPSLVTASNGLSPYVGAAGGQATLADLIGGVKLLSGPKIDHQIGNNNSDFMTVTLKIGVLPQYFTPANFSSVITLTMSNGP